MLERMNKGTLIVKPQSAQLQHNRDLFHKMDPYCIVTIGSQKLQTSVAKRQGKTPAWADSLKFVVNGEATMAISMFDKDHITKDAFIGETVVNLNEVY